jgi:hypothetical protein
MTGEDHKHEYKACPKCGTAFTCKVGDVSNCQCNTVKLSEEAYDLISKKYDDCLCSNCMLEMNSKQFLFKERFGNSPH